MKSTVSSQKIYPFLLSAYKWYLLTPERSLSTAYQAAIKIKEIEDKHFNGNKYVNAIGGQKLYNKEDFNLNDIELNFIK